MIQLSISAPNPVGAHLQICHTAKPCALIWSESVDFLGGSPSRLWIRRVVPRAVFGSTGMARDSSRIMPSVRAIGDPGQSTFLSLEEAGLIEMTSLDMHEKFLARLTVSSLNLLKEISEQEGVPIEELNAGKLCDWFVRDKEKRQKNIEEATLKWNTPEW